MIQHLPAVVVLLTVLLQVGTLWATGHARGKYGIQAPAISGHAAFERAWRVQMNTLEATVIFLPTLWLAVQYGYPLWASVAGLVWVVGRVWYAVAYLKEAAKRSGGFLLSSAAWAVMLVLGVIGLVRAMMIG
ncbi:MAPEG family protein [Dyella kyungheensis]|jgi:uncharacterized MAPEG superfamily protein|uniref:MAPEG family protein n=1 Tax=Dyella kyungheensis TaxID=1242174 RepID=A0ABS2JPI1_9GAMM|nr:MAPEG family protein [Dyella kyungheensis]MBM7120740.1 MAPEG family protein [Dyella kyungheensis]